MVGSRRGGEEFPAEISVSPIKTGEGVLICIAVRDITERKRAEEHVRQSQELVTKAFHATPSAVASSLGPTSKA